MKSLPWLLATALLASAQAAEPDPRDLPDPRLVVECQRAIVRGVPNETTLVNSTRDADPKPDGQTRFVVDPGQSAECAYPSGHSVRVKVGYNLTRAFGRCGADAPIIVSIWIDRRKVESREWFAGHCYEGGPLLSYEIGRYGVQKCRNETCVTFPALERFPVDREEYPPAGTKRPVIGEIELVRGNAPVCGFARSALRADFDAPFAKHHPAPKPPAGEDDDDAEESYTDDLRGATGARYDFDNDGHPDEVFEKSFENTYMEGSVLLVRPAQRGSEPWFLPCQLDASRPAMKRCPPFSQDSDEAKVTVAGARRGEAMDFWVRYTQLTPFRFQGKTFLALSSRTVSTLGWIGIVEPRPGRRVESRCLLRRVSENY